MPVHTNDAAWRRQLPECATPLHVWAREALAVLGVINIIIICLRMQICTQQSARHVWQEGFSVEDLAQHGSLEKPFVQPGGCRQCLALLWCLLKRLTDMPCPLCILI
jgi:hypothetical protein